jgi:hypothetical protein
MRVVRGFPAMVIASVALVVALGGIAVAQGGSGGVDKRGAIRSCLAQDDGSLRVIRTGESCTRGTPVPIIRNRWIPITSDAVAKGSHAVFAAVRIDHHGRLDKDVRIRCGLRLPNGRLIPDSVVVATFEKGDAGDTVLPITVTIDRMPGGRLTLACKEIARGGRRATVAAVAAPGSPGVLSGNIVQIPIDIPVNVCGNTVAVISRLNPGIGNTCGNN